MQKDFEAQKIKLKSFIDENIAVSFDEHFCIHELIDTLQPPKPTCSTCDHCEHHEIDCGEGMLSDCYRCLSDKLDWNMLPYIEEPTNFGCIHHSDYEVAE